MNKVMIIFFFLFSSFLQAEIGTYEDRLQRTTQFLEQFLKDEYGGKEGLQLVKNSVYLEKADSLVQDISDYVFFGEFEKEEVTFELKNIRGDSSRFNCLLYTASGYFAHTISPYGKYQARVPSWHESFDPELNRPTEYSSRNPIPFIFLKVRDIEGLDEFQFGGLLLREKIF